MIPKMQTVTKRYGITTYKMKRSCHAITPGQAVRIAHETTKHNTIKVFTESVCQRHIFQTPNKEIFSGIKRKEKKEKTTHKKIRFIENKVERKKKDVRRTLPA